MRLKNRFLILETKSQYLQKKLSLFLERHEFITVITGSDAVLGRSGVLSDRFLELFELRQGHGGWLLSFLSITLVPAVRIFDTV